MRAAPERAAWIPTADPPPFALASPTGPAPPAENADFEGPHVFEEEEQDSEVFSDLEF